MRADVAAAVALDAMDIEELHARVLQSLADHGKEPEKELVPIGRMGLERLAEHRRLKRDRLGGLEGPCVQAPAVWGGDPRPTEDLAGSDRLDREPRAVGGDDLERHFA